MIQSYQTNFFCKKQLNQNTFLFTFKLINPPTIDFIPGQYLILQVNGKPRLYSIASSSEEKGKLEFIIKIFPNGMASSYLEKIKPGDKVVFQGPIGQFVLKENDKKKVFLITGAGIAPVRSMLRDEKIRKEDIFLFWGLKKYADTYLTEEFKVYNFKICLSREESLETVPIDERKFFNLGYVGTALEKNIDFQSNPENYEFYLCGSREIVESLKQSLLEKGVLPGSIISEKF
ncbi:hypothetical protein B6D29_01480 [Microgenomates bacterium UTCPR1]|nr:FAD-dependent oxidoreductase [Patescibacteria group bacterium]OQY67872.1 MAG: hypothetical protein B6D29_01480 [Microgenomates bacterium UTCPR1]